MPAIQVDGVNIAYEDLGTGPTVVWTQALFFPRAAFSYFFAGRLSEKQRVLIWDKPNTGESDFVLRDTPSEWHLCCDILHGMCRDMGILPAYFAGASGGGELSLLMAHLYPQDVKGLIIHRPTKSATETAKAIVQARYYALADAAESEGMEGALNLSENPPDVPWARLSGWVAEISRSNPENRRRVLETAQLLFAKVLRTWGDWLVSGAFHRANLSDNDLAGIHIPTIVSPGDDPDHTEAVARDLLDQLPNSTWADPTDRWTPEESERFRAGGHLSDALLPFMPLFQEFIDSVENS